MRILRRIGFTAGLAMSVAVPAYVFASEPTIPPEPATFPAEGKIHYVPRDSILELKALPEHH